jgi:pimeloyl-ACP methyl ester carboxylesterase
VARLYVGWHELHPDVSLNFQLNRWAAFGGPSWVEEVRKVVTRLSGYDAWRDTFLQLGDAAEADGRTLAAALHLRCSEFFMLPTDSRKEPTRQRLLNLFRRAAGEASLTRSEVPFGYLRLPVYRFKHESPRGALVVFGGFDSYIEEWFPLLDALRATGFDVIAFEGPGQGSVLEEQRARMTHEWHRPVGAVLDAFGLDDVTLLGVSLGGCLVVRAAAFEPRVRRVVAFDVLTDFTECMHRSHPLAVAALARGLLALHADPVFDAAASAAAPTRPLMEWGLAQALHVFGSSHPSDAFRVAAHYVTKDVAHRLEQDVLLLAGAEDHYVPGHQLADQAASLTHARSVTSRTFTRRDHAQAHCQVGNLPLVVKVLSAWFDTVSPGR